MDGQTEQLTPTDHSTGPDTLETLWNLHNERPVASELWNRVVARAKWEETSGQGAHQYDDIPLEAFLRLADEARSSPSSIQRYRLLTKPSPNGALWFDTLYGLTAPEVINTVRYYISQVRWMRGLDLGTGTGILARTITRHCSEVIALDQSEMLLRVAKQRHHLVKGGKFKIHEVTADVMHLPLPDQSADLAVSSGLTSWLRPQELDDFVGELKRVLTPGGFYVSALPVSSPGDVFDRLHRSGRMNAKLILADMIVDVINGSHQKKPEETVDLRQFINTFQHHEFAPFVNHFPQYGAAVTSFQKPGQHHEEVIPSQ